MTVSEPPSSKMAAPPSVVVVVSGTSVVKPSSKARFCTVSRGVATFHALVMCRMREVLPPLRVTSFPAVDGRVARDGDLGRDRDGRRGGAAVEGDDPAPATAAVNAAAVQLAGVPVPTTVVGCETSTAVAGTAQVAPGAAPSKPVEPAS